ncbi:P-loop containing nucleoside triphosphate hydrolase protein, partial [Kalaharituber pfeilii]
IRIAVMGVTGAGKSTFIQTITGDKKITIGHNLESCTQVIQSWPWTYKGMNITFIDTPGFNDTNKSEGEILRELSDWLMYTYQQDAKLSGILYLHRISDIRMEGSALRNLRVFQKLCGEASLQHVILVTTHWASVSEATGESRENELLNSYWRGMREKGSKVMRFKGTETSGIEIISEFLNSNLGETSLEIQREMVDQNKNLADTSAGKAVNEEM